MTQLIEDLKTAETPSEKQAVRTSLVLAIEEAKRSTAEIERIGEAGKEYRERFKELFNGTDGIQWL